MNEKEKIAFDELVDEFEKYKRDHEKRISDLEEKVKKMEVSANGS